jgi:starvation-inducible DNA-binding protein
MHHVSRRGGQFRIFVRSERDYCSRRVGTRRATVDHAKELLMTEFTIPGLAEKDGAQVADMLQKQLSTYNDLHLTLKHIHWNVVGPNFIGVHEMIDPQVDLVRAYADEVAERIATLGKSPMGTPGAILKDRTWDDYSVGRDTVQAHLAALDLVYTGVIEDTRKAIHRAGELDPVTENILEEHAAELEKFQWFVRAHLENAGGQLANRGARTEKAAARSAKKKSPVK